MTSSVTPQHHGRTSLLQLLRHSAPPTPTLRDGDFPPFERNPPLWRQHTPTADPGMQVSSGSRQQQQQVPGARLFIGTPPATAPASYLSREDGRPRPSTPKDRAESAMPPQEPTSGVRRARKLIRLVDKILFRRTQLDYEQQSLFREHGLLLETARTLTAALDSESAQSGGQTALSEIARLRQLYESDFQAVQRREATAAALRNDLSTLEFNLQRKEERLVRLLNAAEAVLYAPTISDDTSVSSDHGSAARLSDTPSLLARFFDRKGDEGIYRERLQELELFYDEGLVSRELIIDRGDSLDVPDAQFKDEYLTQRNQILSDLRAAEADVAELAAQCAEAQISTEIPRPLSSEAAVTRPESSYYNPPIGPPIVPNDLRAQAFWPMPTDLPANLDPIRGWLDHVDVEEADLNRPQSLDPLRTPAESENAANELFDTEQRRRGSLIPRLEPRTAVARDRLAPTAAESEGQEAVDSVMPSKSTRPSSANLDLGLQSPGPDTSAEAPAASWSQGPHKQYSPHGTPAVDHSMIRAAD